MLKLFQLLFHGCAHKWETIERVPCDGWQGGHWTRTYCKCTKCGRPTKFD